MVMDVSTEFLIANCNNYVLLINISIWILQVLILLTTINELHSRALNYLESNFPIETLHHLITLALRPPPIPPTTYLNSSFPVNSFLNQFSITKQLFPF